MIQALSDRIFVRLCPFEAEKKTLILPETALPTDTANTGEVISVGELVTSVQIGDKIIFHPFDELATPDPAIVVIREKSLLGRWDKV